MRKGKNRFGGGNGGEPAAKRQAAGSDEGIVVAEVSPPSPVLSYRPKSPNSSNCRTLTQWIASVLAGWVLVDIEE
jgi:hypothetical protein